MGWARMDDQRHQHPKVLAISLEADGLWGRALTWAAGNLTDGYIPASALPSIANGDKRAPKLAAELVRERHWELAEGGWIIHDYHDYNPEAATVKAERAAAAERMKARREQKRSPEVQPNDDRTGGERSGSVRRTCGPVRPKFSFPDPDPVLEAKPNPSRHRSQSEPTPVPAPRSPPATHTPDPTVQRFADFWAAWPPRNGKKLARDQARHRFGKLTEADQEAALIGARHYADACRLGSQGAMDAWRWLRDRSWTDWQTPATPDPPRPAVNGHAARVDDELARLANVIRADTQPTPDRRELPP